MGLKLHKMSNFMYLVCIFILVFQESYTSFTEVTDQVLGGPLNGLLATFSDFNMDKRTDVFVITDNGHIAELYLKGVSNTTNLLELSTASTIQRINDTITSIAAGDFNGDFQMDVLITTKSNADPFDKSTPTKAIVYWGDVSTLAFDNWTLVTDQLADQPLVMDYNADLIPDIFGEVMNGHKKFWTRDDNDTENFHEVNLVSRENYHLVVPNSNAFLDLTGNYAANLFMTTNKSGLETPTFEIWSYVHKEESNEPHSVWQFTTEYTPPDEITIEHLGVSTFADMNADGFMDHILPVCTDASCTSGGIYVRFHQSEEWTEYFSLSDLAYEGATWGFVPPTTQLTDYTVLPLVARTGDYNLDTLTDVLVLVQAARNGAIERRIVLLKNTGQELVAAWSSEPNTDISSPIAAAFIDIQRTGQLDILVINQTVEGVAQTLLMDNMLDVDAYFIQTEVLSGLCPGRCPGHSRNIPYGVNPPGPTVRYTTTSSTGSQQRDGGTQLSQSAYFALQLPYVLLGLGQNPNFIDTLTVGVPAATIPGKKNNRIHEWTSVIPNSQLIAIPYPLDDPSSWISKIIIIPGQSVLLTGVVLICTCVVLALTASLLHLKERKDDEKEKRQEAHRFHFDAM